MKKLSLVITIIVFVVLGSISSSFAEGFSFAKVNWNDNPNQVLEKVKILPNISYTSFHEDLQNACILESIFLTPMIDKERWEYLRNKGLSRKRLGGINWVKNLEINGDDKSIIDFGKFSFSFSNNKLLSYTIKFKNKEARKERDGGNQVYKSLVEKYGPSSNLKWAKKWSDNGESLYYFFLPDSHCLILTYMNDKNLENHLNRIEDYIKNLAKKNNKETSNKIKSNF